MSGSPKRCFHSSYVTDVKFYDGYAQIQDSGKMIWNVDLNDKEIVMQFKSWLQNMFLKGPSQTLTVFEYEDRSTETDFDFWIKKFCNVPSSGSSNPEM